MSKSAGTLNGSLFSAKKAVKSTTKLPPVPEPPSDDDDDRSEDEVVEVSKPPAPKGAAKAKDKTKEKPPLDKHAAMKKQPHSLGKARALAAANAREDAAVVKKKPVADRAPAAAAAAADDKKKKPAPAAAAPAKTDKTDHKTDHKTGKLTSAEIASRAEVAALKERNEQLRTENEALRCQTAASRILATDNGVGAAKWDTGIKDIMQRLGHEVHVVKKRKISGSEADPALSDSSDDEEETKKKKKTKRTKKDKDPDAKPRARTGLNFFCKLQLPEYKKEGLNAKEAMKRANETWKGMDTEAKATYMTMNQIDKDAIASTGARATLEELGIQLPSDDEDEAAADEEAAAPEEDGVEAETGGEEADEEDDAGENDAGEEDAGEEEDNSEMED